LHFPGVVVQLFHLGPGGIVGMLTLAQGLARLVAFARGHFDRDHQCIE
jgi:hypothetical protein